MADVLAAFTHVRKAGDGWLAQCPAHEDQRASLSIAKGTDGRWLLNCHAGCTFDAIVSAAHLTKGDLWPPASSHGASRSSARELVATYRYVDENGGHLYDVLRYHPKDFRQRRADGTWSLADGERFVRLFREVWQRVPARDRRRILAAWERQPRAVQIELLGDDEWFSRDPKAWATTGLIGWQVKFYEPAFTLASDAANRFTMAHELGHVVSLLTWGFDYRRRYPTKAVQERDANQKALKWLGLTRRPPSVTVTRELDRRALLADQAGSADEQKAGARWAEAERPELEKGA